MVVGAHHNGVEPFGDKEGHSVFFDSPRLWAHFTTGFFRHWLLSLLAFFISHALSPVLSFVVAQGEWLSGTWTLFLSYTIAFHLADHAKGKSSHELFHCCL